MRTGRCHCGAIRYQLEGEPIRHAVCHCTDCRRHAGAPLVAWVIFPSEALTVLSGEPRTYRSSEHGHRQFCAECGTGLFYTNDHMFPGRVDVQSTTLDEPDSLSPPELQVQTAERLGWVRRLESMPAFERFPQPEE